jgi:hypothetical protein
MWTLIHGGNEMKKIFLASVLAVAFSLTVYAQGVNNPDTPEGGSVRIKIIFSGKTLTATMADNESARDFITLLPVTVTMHEFRNREKYGRLPRPLVRGGVETHAYEVGDVIYSPVRSNLAFFYAADIRGTDVPVIVIGKINSGLEAFESIQGTIEARVELENQTGR